MSKIESGKTVVNEIDFDLHRMLDDLEESIGLRARGKDLSLVVEHAPDVPRHVLIEHRDSSAGPCRRWRRT